MPNLVLVKDFIFGGISISGLTYKDEPVFIGNQIAKRLGYARPQNAVKKYCTNSFVLKYDECPPQVKINKIEELSITHGIILIKESDLYCLIMKSTLPDAKKFQDWVCEEVLPAIRKTGSYSAHRAPTLTEKDTIEVFNRFFESGENVDFSELAGVFGNIGRNNLIKFLRDRKIMQVKKALPYRKFIDLGYFAVVVGLDDFKIKTLVTPRGALWVYKQLNPQKTLFNFIDEEKRLKLA